MSNEMVSLDEVRERFYEEDIELIGTAGCLIEITIPNEQRVEGQQDVWLRFGEPGTPSHNYLGSLADVRGRDDVQIVFGLADERIWRCGDREDLTFDEAWERMGRTGSTMVGVKRHEVEIALYRGQDDEGEVTHKVGIQLHFGEPEPEEEGVDPYDFSGWMEPTHTLSGEEYFHLDDVPVAFNIDPAQKMWEINGME